MVVGGFTQGSLDLGGNVFQLPNGAIPGEVLEPIIFRNTLPEGIDGVGPQYPNREIREPISRMIQALGNTPNPDNFIATTRDINTMKGRLFGFKSPRDSEEFDSLATDAATGQDDNAAAEIFTILNTVRTQTSYEYIRTLGLANIYTGCQNFRVSPGHRRRSTSSPYRVGYRGGVGSHRKY